MASTGAEATSLDPVRRDPTRSERIDRTDRTDRDRAERRERREQGLLRDLGRSNRSPVRRDSRRDSQRLDVPREKRRLIRRPRFEDDAFGRFAEQFARFMGTARFLLYMTAFVVAWVLYNWLSPRA